MSFGTITFRIWSSKEKFINKEIKSTCPILLAKSMLIGLTSQASLK